MQSNFLEAMMIKSFRYFCELGLKQKIGKMHEEWIRLVEHSDKHICIMSARGHFKTSILSVAYPLWLAYRSKKKIKIVVTSATLSQSGEIMTLIKDKINEISILHEKLKPENIHSTKWSESKIRTKNGHDIISVPFGDGVRGHHPDVCICDDVLRAGELSNVETAKDTFWGTVYPIINARKGKFVVVGTPISYTDLLMQLSEVPTFDFRKYPAVILDSNGEWKCPQFPEHYDEKQLRDTKDTMPPDKWSREYMCEPLSSDTSMFPHDMLKKSIALHKELNILYSPPQTTDEEVRKNQGEPIRYMGCDIAVSENKKADWSVFTVLEKLPGHPVYMRDMVRKHLNTESNIEEIKYLQRKYKCKKILVEYTGVGTGVSQLLESPSCSIRNAVVPFDTKRKSKEKILGNLEVAIRNGTLAILDNEILIGELNKMAYTRNKQGVETYESLGKHDDTVMSLAIALEAVNVGRPVSLAIV